jgi:hypothetical protein
MQFVAGLRHVKPIDQFSVTFGTRIRVDHSESVVLSRVRIEQCQIRIATTAGRFLGGEATVRRLEQELGKRLPPVKRGRNPNPTQGGAKIGEILA